MFRGGTFFRIKKMGVSLSSIGRPTKKKATGHEAKVFSLDSSRERVPTSVLTIRSLPQTSEEL